MTLEQFEGILKNNLVYKKFKRIATDDKKIIMPRFKGIRSYIINELLR